MKRENKVKSTVNDLDSIEYTQQGKPFTEKLQKILNEVWKLYPRCTDTN